MSKHTPGPWVALSTDYVNFEIWAHHIKVASINRTPKQGDPASNATLIAAAPELLAAAKLVLACNPGAAHLNGENGEMYAEFEKLAAAIAKAEGRG